MSWRLSVQKVVENFRERVLHGEAAVFRERVSEERHIHAIAQIGLAELSMLAIAQRVVKKPMLLAGVRMGEHGR